MLAEASYEQERDGTLPSLFENAVASIRMGVEDYRQQDADRDVSAVRNFYAGMLLLAKEAITRKAPNVDPALILGAKLKPVPDGNGGATVEQVGHATVDFQQVVQRAKDFGVDVDGNVLERINRIRNDMEHHFTSESSTAIREAISKGFPVVASLFRQMEEDPLELLDEAWQHMLKTKELYDQEVKAAQGTYANVKWHSQHMGSLTLMCPTCRSELIAQTDPTNDSQSCMSLTCRNCGEEPDISSVIEYIVDDVWGVDNYNRVKDGDGDGTIFRCPACENDTLLDIDNECVNCGEIVDYKSECYRCSNDITLGEYLVGLDGGLCDYCQHVSDKMMRED